MSCDLPKTSLPIVLFPKNKQDLTKTISTTQNGNESTTMNFNDISDRMTKLEQQIYNNNNNYSSPFDESMRRARNHIESKLFTKGQMITSTVWKWVPPHYYTLDLPERAKILNATSTQQLCKSMLMENRATNAPKDCKDRTNARFYLVVVQYDATINTKKLESEIRGLRPLQSGTRLDKTDLDFRMATEDDNELVTGYAHNSVTPFGLLNEDVPIVLSKAILDVMPGFIWMGGGHVNLKLGMAVSDFVDALDAFILNVSDLRK